MKKAAVYMRMSTDRQEHSIESQWRLISDWAKKNDYTVVKQYQDEGISGKEDSIKKRTAFLQMIDDSEKDLFDYVIVYDSSRFSRSLKDSITYKSILKQNNVQLISITEPVLDDDSALITDAITGAMNELYIRKLSKNVKRGQEQKVIRGEVFSKPPYGYYRPYPGSPFAINEDEAKIVHYIYDQFEQGATSYTLATQLSKAVKTKRGNPFDNRQVERILTNPIYKGWMDITLNGTRYYKQSDHPAIIDPEQFDRVQDLIQERGSKRKKHQKPKEVKRHWLSGKLRCGVCGGSLYRRDNGPHRNASFLCTNYARGTCKSPHLTQPVLENAFLECCRNFVDNVPGDSSVELIAAPVLPVETDYDAEIAKLQRGLNRAKEAYLAEIDTLEEYKINKAKLENEIAVLTKAKEKNASPPSLDAEKTRESVKNLIELLIDPEAPMDQKKSAMEATVDKVILHPDKTVSVVFFA